MIDLMVTCLQKIAATIGHLFLHHHASQLIVVCATFIFLQVATTRGFR